MTITCIIERLDIISLVQYTEPQFFYSVIQELSHPVKCSCGEEYRVELGAYGEA